MHSRTRLPYPPTDPHRLGRRIVAACTLCAMLVWASAGHAVPRTFRVDPDHFFVTFLVGHEGYAKVIGRFMRGRGSFVYDVDTQEIDSGTFSVYSRSVFTGHYRRDKLFRSPLALAVSDHPQIVFEISNFRSTGPNKGQLAGQLTMLGETHEVIFDLTINRVAPRGEEGHLVLGASARMTIARSRWGMTGGGRYADGVELLIELEALQTSN